MKDTLRSKIERSTLLLREVFKVKEFSNCSHEDGVEFYVNLHTLAARLTHARKEVYTRVVSDVEGIIEKIDSKEIEVSDAIEKVYFKNLISSDELREIYAERDSPEGMAFADFLQYDKDKIPKN